MSQVTSILIKSILIFNFILYAQVFLLGNTTLAKSHFDSLLYYYDVDLKKSSNYGIKAKDEFMKVGDLNNALEAFFLSKVQANRLNGSLPLDQIESAIKQMTNEHTNTLAESYLNLLKGSYHFKLEQHLQAIEYFNKALLKLDDLNSPHLIYCLVKLNLCHREMGFYQVAENHLLQGLKKLNPNQPNIHKGYLFSNLGWFYLMDSPLNSLEKATKYTNKALQLLREEQKVFFLIYTLMNKSRIELINKNYLSSETHLKEGLTLINENQELSIGVKIKFLLWGASNLYLNSNFKQYERAKLYLDEALYLSIKNNNKEYIAKSYEQLQEYFYKTNKIHELRQAQIKRDSINKIIFSENNLKRIAEQEIEMNLLKKEIETQKIKHKLNEANFNNKIIILWLIIVFIGWSCPILS